MLCTEHCRNRHSDSFVWNVPKCTEIRIFAELPLRLFGDINHSHPSRIVKIRVVRFVQRKVSGGPDALAKDVNLAGRTEQRLETLGFLVRICRVEPDKVGFPRANFVIELLTRLISAGIHLGHAGIPEIIHIETNDAVPINAPLTSKSLKESKLTFTGSKNDTNLVTRTQQLPYSLSHSGSCLRTQIVLVFTEHNLSLSIIHEDRLIDSKIRKLSKDWIKRW